MENGLRQVLNHLAREEPREAGSWRGWWISPIADTVSGLTYRATTGGLDLGIRFATPDGLDRAGREYACLLVLYEAGLRIAPEPVLLDRESYPRPAIVRTWLPGQHLEAIPEEDAPWKAILSHLLAVHSVTPESTRTSVPPAAPTMRSAAGGLALLEEHLARELPDAGDAPPDLEDLLEAVRGASYPSWPEPPKVLCRGDCNRYNFLLRGRPGEVRCVSFDLEYGGWGDPAYEVADLICAPTFAGMPDERKDWLVREYARGSGDETLALRARTYHCLMNAYWAIRFARFLKEVRQEQPEGEPAGRLATAYRERLALARAALRRLQVDYR